MKKALMLFTVMISTVLFSTAVFAAAWNVPTNVRIVQKSNTDTTGRIYGNIQSAINSITNASATNPYVVKVMPGVYDLGTASLQMKEYVDLEGSGPDNTIITSSNYNIDGGTCTVGTVLMANNSSIRHIKIVNNPPVMNGAYTTVAALVFNNVKAKAEGISVLTGSDTVDGGQNNGICTYGPSADAFLNNINIETHNNTISGQSNPIMFMGGNLTVANSTMTGIITGGGFLDLINDNSVTPGSITVNNCTIEGTSLGGGMFGIYSGSNKVSISNSTITLNVGNGSANAFQANGNFTMANSRIISDSPTVGYSIDGGGSVKIANSLIPGSSNLQFPNVKLTNNYDENFNPIPNQ